MARSPLVLLLTLLLSAPLAGQVKEVPPPPPERAGSTMHSIPADPDSAAIPEAADEADEEGVGTRAIGGAMVGAVTGAVLSAQGSDCAPAGTAGRASFVGAIWGALRGALRREDTSKLPLPDSRDGSGENGPYPFDGRDCKIAEDD